MQEINLGFEFTYFNTVYTEIKININGFVCFGKNKACDDEDNSCMGSRSTLQRPYPHDLLVGLNFCLSTVPQHHPSGRIYFERLNSVTNSDYTLVKSYINVLNPSFSPSNMFLIVFDEVWPYYASNYVAETPASFQIFLSSNSTMSFVLFKYTSCLKGQTLFASSGLNHDNGGILEEVNIVDGEQCTGSNVNQKGVWVFEVTSTIPSKILKCLE